jgi:MFS transporter, Spinster family, sphingosine-1-phosphate transporter
VLGLQHDFELNLFQLGILPAAFMVGLLIASISFAELTKHIDAFRLIGADFETSSPTSLCSSD